MQAGARADREPQALIERPRLAARCAQSRVIVLEAPEGIGKSTLAEQLAVGATTIVRLFLATEDSSSRRLVTRLRDGCRTSHLVPALVVDLYSAHGVDPGASPGFGVGFGVWFGGDDGVSTIGRRAVVAGRRWR